MGTPPERRKTNVRNDAEKLAFLEAGTSGNNTDGEPTDANNQGKTDVTDDGEVCKIDLNSMGDAEGASKKSDDDDDSLSINLEMIIDSFLILEDGHKKTVHQHARANNLASLQLALDDLSDDEKKRKVNELDAEKRAPLHYACRYGTAEMVEYLLKLGADVGVRDNDNLTPLHYAARYSMSTSSTGQQTTPEGAEAKNEPPVVTVLIENGAKVDELDKYGMTPLHYAALNKNAEAAKILIDNKCKIEVADRNRVTPLLAACAHQSGPVLLYLLKAGANPFAMDYRNNTALHLAAKAAGSGIMKKILQVAGEKSSEDRTKLLTAKNKEGDTALHLAVAHNWERCAQVLLEAECPVNELGAAGETALHSAAGSGILPLVKLLVKHDADTSIANAAGEIPLHKAAAFNQVEIIDYLATSKTIDDNKGTDEEELRAAYHIQLGAKDNLGRTPFLTAVIKGHIEAVKAFLNAGCDVFIKDYEERNCLFLAAQCNHKALVQFFLSDVFPKFEDQTKCSVENSKDCHSNTPLHIAAANGSLEMVELLCQDKENVGLMNEDGAEPIIIASKYGNAQVVKYFLDIKRRLATNFDESYNTSLHYAAKEGHTAVMELLIDAGADMTATNAFGETPLDLAITNNRLQAVELWLKKGAPVEPPFSQKTITTPLHLAAKYGYADILKALLKKNATIDRLDGRGQTCLSIAITNNRRQCVAAILKHKQWRSVMRASVTPLRLRRGQTPLRALIREFPDLAEVVFNNCLKQHGKSEDDNFRMECDYEFLDDSFIVETRKLLFHDEITREPQYELAYPYDKTGRLLEDAQLYTYDYDRIMKNHPLRIMVTSERQQLLSHPLVLNLLQHKWDSIGCWTYYAGLLLYFSFLMLLTGFITLQPAWFNLPEIGNFSGTVQEIFDNETLCQEVSLEVTKSYFMMAAPLPIILLAVVQVLKEGYQFYQRRRRYLTFENLLEVSVYLMAVVVVVDFTECSRITGVRLQWQWILAGFCLFCAWINLLFLIRKLPTYGIYVVMFFDVLRTFSQFFIVFALFVISFSLLFFVWLQNKVQFSTVSWSMFKTTMMMIGEMDFSDLFFGDSGDARKDEVFTSPWLNVFLLIFVIVMTILLMNLLVGLAVDDIKSVQEKAELTRLAMQVEIVLTVERSLHGLSNYFPNVQRWSAVGKETVTPNQMSMFKMIRRIFGGFSSANAAESEGAADEPDPDAKMKQAIEDVKSEVKQCKQCIDEQKALIADLIKKLETRAEKADVCVSTEAGD